LGATTIKNGGMGWMIDQKTDSLLQGAILIGPLQIVLKHLTFPKLEI
jgi:hypothetical protein